MDILRAKHMAERRFMPDDEGGELFHPWGSFGPSTRVDDMGLRARLLRVAAVWYGLAHLGYYLWFLWVGFYRGDDALMKIAPLLLYWGILLMAYRILLRTLTRGCSTATNRWSEREREAEGAGHWVRFAVMYLVVPYLLLQLGGLFG